MVWGLMLNSHPALSCPDLSHSLLTIDTNNHQDVCGVKVQKNQSGYDDDVHKLFSLKSKNVWL